MTSPPPHHDDAARQLADALAASYPEDVLRGLGQDTAEPGAIAIRLLDPEHLQALLHHPPSARAALAALALHGDPCRGDQVRREAILRGLGDIEPGLRHLIEIGLVVMVPAPGQRDLDLTNELDTRRYLQRELRFPTALAALTRTLLADAPPLPPEPTSNSEEVLARQLATPTLEELEINLLHLTTRLRGHALLLNRDGALNRRFLGRFARGLHFPGLQADPLDLNDARVFERILHLTSLALALGLLGLHERQITTQPEACRAFFNAAEAERDRALLKALRGAQAWDEVLAAAITGQRGLATDARRGALLPSPATNRLQGPRGQLLTDLKKIPLRAWTPIPHVIDLLLALDRGYLGNALAATADASAYAPEQLIRATLTCALAWTGIAEIAADSAWDDIPRFIRLTPRGMRMLKVPDAPPAAPLPSPAPPSLLVLPNFEVTVFLQDATLKTLHALYQVGERIQLTNHTATFRLTAESTQRGYGHGVTASELLTFLHTQARTPIPENVRHDLTDWERIQQRVTLYADGVLLEYPDPDRLDIIAGTLQHYWTRSPAPLHLGSTEVFLPLRDDEALARAIDIAAAHTIDYEAPAPPCLRTLDDLTLEPLPCGLDIVTQSELARIATPLGPAEEPDAWRLDLRRVRARWPDDPERHLLRFLDARIPEGVPPALELLLMANIRGDVRATVRTGATLILLSSAAACDTLLEIAELHDLIQARLGPTTLLVQPGAEAAITSALQRLGLT